MGATKRAIAQNAGRILFRAVGGFVLLSILLFGISHGASTALGQRSPIRIEYRSTAQDPNLRTAIRVALETKPASLLRGTVFAVTHGRYDNGWALISIASLDGPECSLRHVGSGPCGGLLLAERNPDGNWQASLAGTRAFTSQLAQVPNSFVAADSKWLLDPTAQKDSEQEVESTQSQQVQVPRFKFPWVAGDWEYRQGWHNGALDIGTHGSDRRILASNDGTVWNICPGNLSANVTIRHDGGTYLEYFHIDRDLLSTRIELGKPVLRGQLIGSLRPGTWSYEEDGCGYTENQAADSAHLHWVLPTDSAFVADGWSIEYDDDTWTKQGQSDRDPDDTLPSSNYLLSKRSKPYPTWISWPGGWPYYIERSDSRVRRVMVDDSLMHDFLLHGSCDGAWFSLDAGAHVISYWYERRGDDFPTVDARPHPTITPVCAAEPPTDLPENPSPEHSEVTLVSDVTLPYGTSVTPGQSLSKTWRLENSGNSTWDGYKLKFADGEKMSGSDELAIPRTVPGEMVDLSISLVAPDTPGLHVGSWRVVNEQGSWVQGGKLTVGVNVQAQSAGIALTADPAPPADTQMVRIRARVSDFNNFRAMRLKIDGTVVYELGAPEFYYDWNTSGYAAGEHNIVVEVADQTDISWSNPERRSMTYTLEGNSGDNNLVPNRPTPVANPAYDWYVKIGDAPQLCVQSRGDADGDAITHYRFVATASVGTVDSGWVSTSCHSFGSIDAGTYEWHAQVKDSRGGISGWSDAWHFTVEPPGVDAYIDRFSPTSPSNAEEVKIFACSSGHGSVNITLRVLVNEANDGTDSGEWHIIKELGVPCFNDVDAPVWRTLEYGDGPHVVRVVAMAVEPDAGDIYDTVYTLDHRRPASPRLVAPMPQSGNGGEAVYLNSRSVTFRWEPAIRAESYTLHVSTSPSPSSDTSPIFRQSFDPDVSSAVVTFDQDYAELYWQVEAHNDVGSNVSGDQLIGIDRGAPTCLVEPLTNPVYESVFQVNWSGADNLAGVRAFEIQYKDSERGAWEEWLTEIPADKEYELFSGQPGHTYSFRCRSTDNANNTGTYPAGADTSTMVDPTARPPTPWWNDAWNQKHNITILNNMPGLNLYSGYPLHLHFDGTTTPTAAEIYSASLSSPKCSDLRIVANDATELPRVVPNCSSSAIDIWFRTQVSVPAGNSDNTSHQLYYGNAAAGPPPDNPGEVWYPYKEADTLNLYYLQEGSGSTAYDASGNGRHCSIDSSVSWTQGKFGQGLRFSRANAGDSRSLSCGSAIPRSSFTLEFWYKPDSDDGGRIAGEMAGGGNGGGGNNWLLQLFGGQIRFDVWPCPTCGSSEVRSNFSLLGAQYVNRWNHVAVTFNGANEVKFYINGQLDSTKILSQSGLNSYTPPLEIGSTEGIGQIKARLGAFRKSSGVKTSFPYGQYANISNEPTTALGDAVDPPVTGTVDLAILDLQTYPNPNGGEIVQAVVQNQGDLSTGNGFFTDLYLDQVPAGAGDYNGSLQFWINDPIEPTQTVTLTTVIRDVGALAGSMLAATPQIRTSSIQEISGTLFAQTDSAGALGEPDELNNIHADGTPICIADEDIYEDDNSAAAATLISVADTQTHNIGTMGDEDWVKFEAIVGQTYLLQTANLASSADTYLYLYDRDGKTLLASNDDANSTLASTIEWAAPASGIYYARVRHWNPTAGGCGTSYNLLFRNVSHSNPVYLPLIHKKEGD